MISKYNVTQDKG